MRSKRFAISCFCLVLLASALAISAAPAYAVLEDAWQGISGAGDLAPANESQASGYIIELNEPPVLEKKATIESDISSLLKQAAQARIDATRLTGAARDRKLAEANSLTNQAVLKSQNLSGTLTAQRAKILSDQQKALADIQSRIRAGMGAQSAQPLKTMGEYKNVFNGFALNVSKAEAEALKQSPYVKAVYPNLLLHTTLMDSVPLINADDVWKLKDAAGNSTTGKGVTIAIIDSGVDYTHPDLGNCTSLSKPIGPKPPVVNYVLESPHPFSDGYRTQITKPANFSEFSIHFANVSFGNTGAFMQLYGNKFAWYDKDKSDFWTINFNSDNVSINLHGNGGYGFYIDKISNGTIYSAGCQKVIGGYDFVDDDDDPMDDNYHGTHVASIAAGNGTLKGVAPDAKILAYKAFNAGGVGATTDVGLAVERAVDPNDDGDFSDHADVISMSLELPCKVAYGGYTSFCGPNDLLSGIVNNAVGAGSVVVVAAGNSGAQGASTVGSPGTARNAITVTDSDKSDILTGGGGKGPVLGADFGLVKPDVAAPGQGICAAQYDSVMNERRCFDDKHIAVSGTSMATPHVAGAAALLIQAHPDWTPLEVKMALRGTAKDLGYDANTQGYGRIDALKAASMQVAPPVAQLYTGGYFSGVINIAGIATARSFSGYTVQYGTGDGIWYTIGTYTSPVSGGVLVSNWDTSRIYNNTYYLRLIARDASGALSEDRSMIVTSNENDASDVQYSVTFSQSGMTPGTRWGVGVNGRSYSTTSSSITVSGLSGISDYSYAPPVSASAGTRYACAASCAGSISSPAEITASYQKQYRLTMSASPAGAGTVSPETDWFNAGSAVSISASPRSGYGFSSWTGSGTGKYSGTANPATVTMNSPISETANFNNPSSQLTLSVSGLPNGMKWSVSVSGKTYTATTPNSISVSGLTGNTRYSYGYVIFSGGKLYLCSSGCSGTAAPAASVTASYRKLF